MASCVLFLLVVSVLGLGESSPIVDGVNVGVIEKHKGEYIVKNPGTFSYVVRLEIITSEIQKNPLRLVTTTGICGGVIIRRDLILTAAHCIRDDDQTPIINAWAGILHTKLEKGKGQEIAMKAYRKHESYEDRADGVYQPNDIALIWLKESFDLRNKLIKLATLAPKYFSPTTKRGWVVGWGMDACAKTSPMMKKAVMRIITRDECKKKFLTTKISDKVLCSLNDNKKATTSYGDSGGPIVVQGMVVGIQSFGTAMDVTNKDGTVEETCDPKRPAVCTYVAKYIDWIQEKITQGPPKNVYYHSTLQ